MSRLTLPLAVAAVVSSPDPRSYLPAWSSSGLSWPHGPGPAWSAPPPSGRGVSGCPPGDAQTPAAGERGRLPAPLPWTSTGSPGTRTAYAAWCSLGWLRSPHTQV